MRSHFTECGDARLDVFQHYGHRPDVTGCDTSRSAECHGPDHDAVLHQHPHAAGDRARWRARGRPSWPLPSPGVSLLLLSLWRGLYRRWRDGFGLSPAREPRTLCPANAAHRQRSGARGPLQAAQRGDRAEWGRNRARAWLRPNIQIGTMQKKPRGFAPGPSAIAVDLAQRNRKGITKSRLTPGGP